MAGVPFEASVAATFCAAMPDLPTPLARIDDPARGPVDAADGERIARDPRHQGCLRAHQAFRYTKTGRSHAKRVGHRRTKIFDGDPLSEIVRSIPRSDIGTCNHQHPRHVVDVHIVQNGARRADVAEEPALDELKHRVERSIEHLHVQ
jgi:hypothetical protein